MRRVNNRWRKITKILFLIFQAEENEDNGAEKAEDEKIDFEEVMTFKDNCPSCNAPCDTNMKMIGKWRFIKSRFGYFNSYLFITH